MKKRLFVIGMLLFAFVIAGCGGSPGPVEYTIEMSEFAYSPNTIELQVGQEVTLNLVNNGALTHEFMVGQESVKNEDGQFIQYEQDFFISVDPVVSGVGEVHDMSDSEHMDDMADDHDMGDMADDHDMGDMADDHDMHEMSDDHKMTDHGFMVSIGGNTADRVTTIKFIVTEDMVGEWEMGCFLDGGSHYVAGMVGTITVSP